MPTGAKTGSPTSSEGSQIVRGCMNLCPGPPVIPEKSTQALKTRRKPCIAPDSVPPCTALQCYLRLFHSLFSKSWFLGSTDSNFLFLKNMVDRIAVGNEVSVHMQTCFPNSVPKGPFLKKPDLFNLLKKIEILWWLFLSSDLPIPKKTEHREKSVKPKAGS